MISGSDTMSLSLCNPGEYACRHGDHVKPETAEYPSVHIREGIQSVEADGMVATASGQREATTILYPIRSMVANGCPSSTQNIASFRT